MSLTPLIPLRKCIAKTGLQKTKSQNEFSFTNLAWFRKQTLQNLKNNLFSYIICYFVTSFSKRVWFFGLRNDISLIQSKFAQINVKWIANIKNPERKT